MVLLAILAIISLSVANFLSLVNALMRELHQQLKNFGQVKLNESLAKHTTFKIGGIAQLFLVVESTDKLVAALQYLDGEGIGRCIIGGGSNMLAPDQGLDGVVIQIKNQNLKVKDNFLEADAGCITVAVAQASIQAGLTGFEWGVGVPGTIGGAVRGNAGAMGGEMSQAVTEVTVYRDGEILRLTQANCGFNYRESDFKHSHDVILSVTLALEKTESKEGMKKALEYLQYRNKTQPQGYASTGCIFQNAVASRTGVSKEKLLGLFPEDAEKIEKFFAIDRISAGWLVEKSGMKGAKVGQAAVSDKHGNFVVNLGGATSTEVLTLIEQIKEKVYATTGISIEPEIQII